MIKEKKKITAYNYKKTFNMIVMEYVRTIMLSVLFAFVFTICLSIHARHEMIKNLYVNIEEQNNLEKQLAEQFIQSNTDLLNDIKSKKYSICMHIGTLYETIGDYEKAQIAFESAMEKAKPEEYKAHYKLICMLTDQEKFDEAEAVLTGVKDHFDKKLVKFKARSYIVIGDKYYSIGKFLSAAKKYEMAKFYYDKFKKKDKVVDESIRNRIINSYIKAADSIVKMGYNSDAVRYLKKVQQYSPDNLKVQYKLGIILSDSDPEEAIKYFEPLLSKIPQEIDYGVYCSALMKAANIADLDGRPTKAKYYRHKIHTIDLFIKRKVIYKNDIDVILDSFKVKKIFFTYPLKAVYKFGNMSNSDIPYLNADFVLCLTDKPLETVTVNVANKKRPLLVGGYDYNDCAVKFKKAIFTKKELANYTIKIYAYKDDKFKTLVAETKIPEKSFNNNK